MKLLFVHDHKFRYIEGKFYSTGGLSDNVLKRYTDVFGDVTVIARVIKEKRKKNQYSEISNKNVVIKNGIKLGYTGFINEIKKADYIISRMPSFLGLKAIILARKLNKPCLIELVACPWDSLWNHSLIGKLVAPFMTMATKIITKNASHVLYVTNEFLQRRYPTNGKSINCSDVVLTEFDNNVLKNRLQKISKTNSKLIIGTIAAVDVRYKGQQYIIKALGKLKKQGITNFEYQLVGGGDPTYLKSVAKKFNVIEQVKFLGPKPHEKIFEWLDTIDIYVQPSRAEGLPRSLIEAMSRGLPAFGANTGEIPELLESKYIFTNSRNNIDEICKILLSFNKEIMKIQAERNFHEAKKYNKTSTEKKRLAFFKQFMGDHF